MHWKASRLLAVACAIWGVFAISHRETRASLMITVEQTSSGVQINGSGSVDTSGFSSSLFGGIGSAGIAPREGILFSAAGEDRQYSPISGPTSFGTGFGASATSASGDIFGLAPNRTAFGLTSFLHLPRDYISGSQLSFSMSFAGATLTSLGLNPSTYVWTWGSGASSDSLTMRIANPPAPPAPPSTAVLAALAKASYAPPSRVSGFNLQPAVQRTGAGFSASLYKDANGQYVMAIAGSSLTDPGDWFFADSAFLTGSASLARVPDLASYVSSAVSMFQEVKALIGNAPLTLTGHSLGGAIAQLLSRASGVPAVTFNAPGSGELLWQLADELAPIRTPSGPAASIVNHRVYGDIVSTVGTQLGSEITYKYPSPVVDLNPFLFVKSAHLIDTVISQIGNPSAFYGPTIESYAILTWLFYAYGGGAGLLYTGLSTAAGAWLVDPGGVDGYSFVIESGAPRISSLTLPFLLSTKAMFRVEIYLAGVWVQYGTFSEAERLVFDVGGIEGFRFFVLDLDSLLPLIGGEQFTYLVNFTSDGLVSARLASFSTVPEPSSWSLLAAVLLIFFVAARMTPLHCARTTEAVHRASRRLHATAPPAPRRCPGTMSPA